MGSFSRATSARVELRMQLQILSDSSPYVKELTSAAAGHLEASELYVEVSTTSRLWLWQAQQGFVLLFLTPLSVELCPYQRQRQARNHVVGRLERLL